MKGCRPIGTDDEDQCYSKVVEPIGFKLAPDAELADFLLEQEMKLETKPGGALLSVPASSA
jgi:hypothetical protein